MNLFDFFQTPIGVEVLHAVSILLVALAAYLTYLSHREVKENSQKLDDHLFDHALESNKDSGLTDPPVRPTI